MKTCGHAFNQAPLAPSGFITGAEYDWSPAFGTFIDRMQSGRPLPRFVIGGYDKGYVVSSVFGAGASPAAIKAAKAAIQAMKDGTAIMAGPIKHNTVGSWPPPTYALGPEAGGEAFLIVNICQDLGAGTTLSGGDTVLEPDAMLSPAFQESM